MGWNTYEQQEKVDARLLQKQEDNLEALKALITSEEGEILKCEKIGSGWFDGFTQYQFTVKTGSRSFKLFKGNDDNTSYGEQYEGGGTGYGGFKNIPE